MRLRYFQPAEFRQWWHQMDDVLLRQLDLFRHRWGLAVRISPAEGALGRTLGESLSQHNVSRWGEVRAADVMPLGMDTRADMERAIRLAVECGFTGIGLYPFWRPAPGLHLDVRRDRVVGDPALWGDVGRDGRHDYVGLNDALLAAPASAAA